MMEKKNVQPWQQYQALYLHIPFCVQKCLYCDFASYAGFGEQAKRAYTDAVCREIALRAAEAANMAADASIYFGGGTPSVLPTECIAKLVNALKQYGFWQQPREATIEVNPGAADLAKLQTLHSLGFDNINMDTIAGLPTDTYDGFVHTIDELCGLDPESITIHTLTLKRSSNLFREEERCVDSHISDMVDYGQAKLFGEGYLPYYLYRQKNTVDNLENVGFAKAGFESLYNIYIMEEAQTILAVGAAGSTKLVNTETGKIERLFNYKFPYEYISRYEKMIEKKDKIFEFYKSYLQEG